MQANTYTCSVSYCESYLGILTDISTQTGKDDGRESNGTKQGGERSIKPRIEMLRASRDLRKD